MSASIDSILLTLSEHVTMVERDFVKLGQAMQPASESSGRTALLGAFRALQRLAEAAQPVRAACPTCGRPDAKMEYEAVNKHSGVWKLPECSTCRELMQTIAAVEKVGRSVADLR